MQRTLSYLLAAAFLTLAAPAAAQTAPNALATSYSTQTDPMTVTLDARQASRGIMYSHLTIPVRAGDFTLVYPKWIPGEHGPTGPLGDLAALRVSANGSAPSWNRDKIDMYAFHVTVPQGVTHLDVDFDVLLNGPNDHMATANLAIVNWNRDVLYQQNTNSHDVYVKPTILLPPSWGYGCSLPGARESGGRVDFDTVPLAMLVDSPLDMGRFYKRVLAWSGDGTHAYLNFFADKPQDLEIDPKLLDAYKRMTPEALALYGSRHWNWYNSLLTLSDDIGFQGIEHHQSSDDRADDDFMTNPDAQLSGGDLLTHEFSHSWNGKYRRPDDLTTQNFQIPQQTDLLWVYEGMNQYLGDLLSFRAGIRAPKQYPEYLANIYAQMDTEPGRLTEPLIDTTTAAPYLYEAGGDYSSIRRTANDFYTEGELIWLDADTIIREQTGGAKSLDDFLHLFTEPGVTGPIVKTYTREDVEDLLHQVAPYDWHGFFQRYVYDVSEHPPTDMLARSGWRLVYTSKPNEFEKADESGRHSIGAWYSIGALLSGTGVVRDVREGSAAWNAGLAPGMKIVAMDGQAFDDDVFEYAIKNAQHGSAPIALLTQSGNFFQTRTLNYHGGLRYPHLERIAAKPDMLAKIMAPHAK